MTTVRTGEDGAQWRARVVALPGQWHGGRIPIANEPVQTLVARAGALAQRASGMNTRAEDAHRRAAQAQERVAATMVRAQAALDRAVAARHRADLARERLERWDRRARDPGGGHPK